MDLLSLLNENARLTNAQLAVMLGKTEEEVEKEIADYQQKGIIKGYKALINWEKVDPQYLFYGSSLNYYIC